MPPKLIHELPLDDSIDPDDMFEKENSVGQSKRISGAAITALIEETSPPSLPPGAENNQIVRSDGVDGAIQNSLVTIDDTGSIDIPAGETYNIDGVPHTHEVDIPPPLSPGAEDNQITRADGVEGEIQNSLVTIDDEGTINIPAGETYNIDGTPHTHVFVPAVEDLTTSETDTEMVLAPDGVGGAAWVVPTGGVSAVEDLTTPETDDTLVLAPDGIGGVAWVPPASLGSSKMVGTKAEMTANYVVGSSYANVTGLSASITTVLPNEVVIITAHLSWVKTSATGSLNVSIAIDGTLVESDWNLIESALNDGLTHGTTISFIANIASPGAHTVTVQALRDTDGATIYDNSTLYVVQFTTGQTNAGRVLLAEVTPSGVNTALIMSSIPATYKELVLEYAIRTDAALTNSEINLVLNNDTTASNYRHSTHFGYGTGTSAADGAANNSLGGLISGASSPSNAFSMGEVKIPFYQNTNFNKQVLYMGGHRRDDSTIFELALHGMMEWGNTAAVNRLDMTLVSGNFVAGSIIRLWGIASDNAVPGEILVQRVHTQTGAVATGNVAIPLDDTIPQSSEGTEFMSLAITPIDAGHDLYIDVEIQLTSATGAWMIIALFKDSDTNALAVSTEYVDAATSGRAVHLRHKMAAGTTSPITFKVRAGGNSTQTLTFNGQSGGRLFGGAMASSITISEIQ